MDGWMNGLACTFLRRNFLGQDRNYVKICAVNVLSLLYRDVYTFCV